VTSSSASDNGKRPTAAKSKRGGLGRGLESLIPVAPRHTDHAGQDENVTGAREVPIDAIVPNPYQPRTAIDHARLEELAASIRIHGLMQPLIVTESATDGNYELIAGERRWRASKLAGLGTVAVIVREATPQAKLELAIVENVVRADLSPLEEAVAYRHLIDDFGLSQAEIAERVGRSRVAITNTIRLLAAPEQVQEALALGRITEGHARALLGLGTMTDQVAALGIVLDRALNVRQTEELVRKWALAPERKTQQEPVQLELAHLEERFRSALGTKVALRHAAGGRSRTLTIEFYSDEQLEEFYNRIAGEDIW
jgi:ParB family chromosome partitioning protein